MQNDTDKKLDILVVEDDSNTALAISATLDRQGYQSHHSGGLEDALAKAEAVRPEIVLLDLSLPDGDAAQSIASFKRMGIYEVIVISGTDSPEHTRECLRAGAYDFISKPASARHILASVRRAEAQLKFERVAVAPYPFPIRPGFGSLEGKSRASEQLFAEARVAGQLLNPGSCLITGPAGVLKNDIAASVQSFSPREAGAWLVNCAAENDACVLARFFGEKRAGESLTEGYLHRAREGALVLDDVSALPASVQALLADYIESGQFTPVNSQQSEGGNCSIIGVLRDDPQHTEKENRLNARLLELLAGQTVQVPALSDRRDDIEAFSQQAVRQLNAVFGIEKSISDGFMQKLLAYEWPGNLVELRNLLLMAYRITEPGEEIVGEDFLFAKTEPVVNSRIAPFIGQSLQSAERQLIESTLVHYDNNKRKAAEILGVSVKTLYNRLKSYEKLASTEA